MSSCCPLPSRLEIANVRGRSRLVACRTAPPLKVLNPRIGGLACQVVLSNYGAGWVGDDRIALNVHCNADSILFLGTQANSRVYKTGTATGAQQLIRGRLVDGALAVVGIDPLVLHKGSRFQQDQEWDIAPSAALCLIDWVAAGRLDIGEAYAFDDYKSTIRLRVNGRTALLDPIRLTPGVRNMRSPAVMGRFNHLVSVYLLGNRLLPVGNGLVAETAVDGDDFIASTTDTGNGLFVIRAAAISRTPIQSLLCRLYDRLRTPEWLGFDPMVRKC